MEDFINKYLEISKDIPLMCQIRYIITGVPRYRVEVYGKGLFENRTSHQRSDVLILTSEGEEWQQVINNAKKMLIEREAKTREIYLGGIA